MVKGAKIMPMVMQCGKCHKTIASSRVAIGEKGEKQKCPRCNADMYSKGKVSVEAVKGLRK